MVRRGLTLVVFVAIAALGESGANVADAGQGLHGSIAYETYQSKALAGTMHYSIYLPPGYAFADKRYPVVYFLHGLPASSTSYKSIGQIAAAVEASGR